MKQPGIFLRQNYLTKLYTWEVAIQTVESDPTKETNEWVVKILFSIYAKYYIDKVDAAAVQLDKNQCNTILSMIT